jgi:hypothetical protein
MSHCGPRIRARLCSVVACAAYAVMGVPRIGWSAESVILDVRGYAQEAEQWCWAASGQTVMEFLAPELKGEVCQCRQAELRLSGVKCCSSGDSCTPLGSLDPLCRDPGWPEFGKYGFDVRTTCDPIPESDWDQCEGEALTWRQLTDEIRSGRAVIFSQRPSDQRREVAVGHSMIAFGYNTTVEQGVEKRWVLVFDPKRICRSSCDRREPPCCRGDASWFSYDEYRKQEGHSHWIDFYGIRNKARNSSADRSNGPSPR